AGGLGRRFRGGRRPAPRGGPDLGRFFLHLDELVFVRLRLGLRAPGEYGLGRRLRVQPDRPDGVVVAGNDVVHAVGLAVRIDHAHHGHTELVGLGHGDVLVPAVDDEHRVRRAGHVLDAAEAALELLALAIEVEQLLLRELLAARVVGERRLELLQALDGAAHGTPVGEHAPEPAVRHVRTAGALRLLGHDLLGLALGADEQNGAAVGRQAPQVRHGLLEQRQGLFQIDDVDLVALAEDVRAHLGVPEAGLVAEMHAGLQHLAHGDVRHCLSFGFFRHGAAHRWRTRAAVRRHGCATPGYASWIRVWIDEWRKPRRGPA